MSWNALQIKDSVHLSKQNSILQSKDRIISVQLMCGFYTINIKKYSENMIIDVLL